MGSVPETTPGLGCGSVGELRAQPQSRGEGWRTSKTGRKEHSQGQAAGAELPEAELPPFETLLGC